MILIIRKKNSLNNFYLCIHTKYIFEIHIFLFVHIILLPNVTNFIIHILCFKKENFNMGIIIFLLFSFFFQHFYQF